MTPASPSALALPRAAVGRAVEGAHDGAAVIYDDARWMELPHAGRPSPEVTRQRRPSLLPAWLVLAGVAVGMALAAVVGV